MCNPKVNIEYHLHLIVDLLLKQMISNSRSLNSCDGECGFREKAARLLARIVIKLAYKLRFQILQYEILHI